MYIYKLQISNRLENKMDRSLHLTNQTVRIKLNE